MEQFKCSCWKCKWERTSTNGQASFDDLAPAPSADPDNPAVLKRYRCPSCDRIVRAMPIT